MKICLTQVEEMGHMVRQASDLKICRFCGIELVVWHNWLESRKRGCEYACNSCELKRSRAYSLKIGRLPMSVNKECASYLGCHIAENVLKTVFDNVKVMKFGNEGYDFICAKGMKIDVKSACITSDYKHPGRWQFSIKRNVIADYFLCLAFDNRDDLNPIHLWLIEGTEINHLNGLHISTSNTDKWARCELDINKVVLKCNMLKGA